MLLIEIATALRDAVANEWLGRGLGEDENSLGDVGPPKLNTSEGPSVPEAMT
jgi:hypothetical protein